MKLTFIISIVILCTTIVSCRKESVTTSADATLTLSRDSIYFDTLFTTAGSITKSFRIFNESDRDVRIGSIRVAGGEQSKFRFNVDGRSGPEAADIEIESKDSVHVFVSVTIDPDDADLPFIVEDSILIEYNSHVKTVQLSAWGQNAYFIDSRIIYDDTAWTNERPIVITGGVLVAEGTTLSIQKGARIFLHADAPILVDGSIQAIGEKYDSTKIIFTGDRLDEYYRDLPGSWPGIYFRYYSTGNLLRYVEIRNAYQGVVAEDAPDEDSVKLHLEQCIIDNCYDAGIIAIRSNIYAQNSLISNCGKNMLLLRGGNYEFLHCTSAAFSDNFIRHEQPVLTVADYFENGDALLYGEVNATFTNCIFWGSSGIVDDEIAALREGTGAYKAEFRNCIVRQAVLPQNATFTGVLQNQDPMFRVTEPVTREYDFRLAEGSPAKDGGVSSSLNFDIQETPRSGKPDIGAFESAF